jgi:Protein of unknown function (DUF3618)
VGQAADELRDAQEIKVEIERTREDMAQTLDAIGDRISPRLQAERQMERLRQSGIEPQRLAMAVAALMFTLLLMRRRRRSRRNDD